MGQLDIRTLVFVSNLMALVMALLFALISRGESSHRYLVIWASAFLCKAVGLLLIYLRQVVPDWVSFVLANTVVVFSYQLLLIGVQRFKEIPVRWWRHVAFIPVVGVGLWVVRSVWGYNAFVVELALILVGLEVAAVWLLLRRVPEGMRLVQGLVAAALASEGLVLTVRAVWHLTGSERDSVFGPNTLTIVFYVEVILLTTMLGTALLAMVSKEAHRRQRDLIDRLEAVIAEVRTLEGLLPICAWCKKIRDEDGTWHPLERFVTFRTTATFSHGVCPDCSARMAEDLERMRPA